MSSNSQKRLLHQKTHCSSKVHKSVGHYPSDLFRKKLLNNNCFTKKSAKEIILAPTILQTPPHPPDGRWSDIGTPKQCSSQRNCKMKGGEVF